MNYVSVSQISCNLGAPEEAHFLVPAREARGVHRHSAANEETMERSLASSPDHFL